jgi:hypothetical protein
MGRRFVVAAWDGPLRIEMDPDEVEADTAEHAILKVMTDHPQHLPESIYAAWPKDEPDQIVKITV